MNKWVKLSGVLGDSLIPQIVRESPLTDYALFRAKSALTSSEIA